MHRQFLLNLLNEYSAIDEHEHQMCSQTINFVNQYENCFERELAPGHITGSAWLVDQDFSQVFFTHHKKLNQWFQPGGHSDGNANTLAVALLEASEESGIEDVFIQPVSPTIFDIDVHLIPARKEEPEHLHYDIRFLLQTSRQHPLKISEESNKIEWIKLDDIHQITQEMSINRMLTKTRRIIENVN